MIKNKLEFENKVVRAIEGIKFSAFILNFLMSKSTNFCLGKDETIAKHRHIIYFCDRENIIYPTMDDFFVVFRKKKTLMDTQKYTMEKIDQIQASLDQIHQISITNSTKIDALPNVNQFKDATANICKSVDNKLKEISNAINRDNNESILLDNHVLDWTMRNDSLSLDCSGRPSIVVKQSIDDNIMDVLKNSEEATWKSIDSLRDLIADQNHLLVSIQNNFLNTAKTDSNPTIVDSNPTLTESVHQTQSIDALKQSIENQHSTLMEIKQKMDAEAKLNERQSVISGNLAATKDGEKEAMTQNNRKTKSKVPEKPKTTQKRQNPTSSARI